MPAWKRVLTLVAFVLFGAGACISAFDRRPPVLNVTLVPVDASNNWDFTVRDPAPGSPLHAGDVVRIRDPQKLAALTLASLAPGSTLQVTRISPGPPAGVSVAVSAGPKPRFAFLVFLLQAMFLIIAGVIAARGGTGGGALSLAWFLALIVFLVNPTTAAWPGWSILAYNVLAPVVAVIAFACAADFASRFTPQFGSSWFYRYRTIAFTVAAVTGVFGLAVTAWSMFMPSTPLLVQRALIGLLLLQAAIFVAGLVHAYRTTRDAERQRTLWVVLSFCVGIAGFVAAVVLGAAGVQEPLRDVPLLLLAAMPIGCAYAILRYRMLDIAFAVNRATVFGITSLLVLAALALVDLGLQHLVGSWLTYSGISVQLTLALAIGIATRPLHSAVDHSVDDLFFRKRHEAERTLRQYARDVAHIDDPETVMRRTVDTVAGASELQCAMLLAGDRLFSATATSAGDHVWPIVDRNDPAVVRLLATREPVDLHGLASGVRGDFAFPMFARNALTGFLACGKKADGIAVYAPDEIEAIGAVATAAGIALDLLRVEALERELDALRGRDAAGAPLSSLRL